MKEEPKVIVHSDRARAKSFSCTWQAFGTYDPKTNEIEMLDGGLMQELTLAHERAHWKQSGRWFKFAIVVKAHFIALLAGFSALLYAVFPAAWFSVSVTILEVMIIVSFAGTAGTASGYISYCLYERAANKEATKVVFGDYR